MLLVARKGRRGEWEMRHTQCTTISFKARLAVKAKVILTMFKETLLITVNVVFHFILPFSNLPTVDLILSIWEEYSRMY